MTGALTRRELLAEVEAGAVDPETEPTDGGDRYNVGVSPGLSTTDVAAVANMALEVHRRIDLDHLGVIVSGRFSETARSRLQRDARVEFVEKDGAVTKLSETRPWGVDRVDADHLHATGRTGSGATVAVLDTGVDDDHPDLPSPVRGECFMGDGSCCGEADCTNGNTCTEPWSDDDDHGTHVAGTIGALDNTEDVIGVGPDIDIMAGKVLDGCGFGTWSTVGSGIEWATDNGADVINMSLGGSDGSSTLENACQYAVDNNVLVVAAAGNDGDADVCDDDDCVGYPAAYSTVIAVSSTDSDDTLSWFSSTGPEVELAAPGGSILSTVPPESDSSGTTTLSGTSMASPHVAGAAALLVAETTLSDNGAIRDRLRGTAEDLGLASYEQGNGLVDTTNASLLLADWHFDVGSRIQYASLATDGSSAFVGSLDETFYALDMSDGSVAWSLDRSGALADSSPAVANGRVFVGSGGGTLYALDAGTGNQAWTASTDSAIVSSPTVAGDVVYVGTNDGRVLALDDTATGDQLWSADVGEAVYSSPVVESGTVYVTTRVGDVVALDAGGGSESWSTALGAAVGHGSPTFGDGRVYVAADEVYALDPSDGSLRWSAAYGGTAGASPVYDASNGQVVVGSADGSAYAFDATDGGVNWSRATGDAVGSTPTLSGEGLAIGSDDGSFRLLDPATGAVLAARNVGKSRSTPLVESGDGILGTWSGTVVALENAE